MPLAPGLGDGDVLPLLEGNQLDGLVDGGKGVESGGCGGSFFVFGWG